MAQFPVPTVNPLGPKTQVGMVLEKQPGLCGCSFLLLVGGRVLLGQTRTALGSAVAQGTGKRTGFFLGFSALAGCPALTFLSMLGLEPPSFTLTWRSQEHDFRRSWWEAIGSRGLAAIIMSYLPSILPPLPLSPKPKSLGEEQWGEQWPENTDTGF